jgi:hypothetical protein
MGDEKLRATKGVYVADVTVDDVTLPVDTTL